MKSALYNFAMYTLTSIRGKDQREREREGGEGGRRNGEYRVEIGWSGRKEYYNV